MKKSEILNSIKKQYNFKTDAEFARFLEIKPQTLATWHSRDTFDIELIYSKCEQIDANWLLSGEGKMLKTYKAHELVNTLQQSDVQETNNKNFLPLVTIDDFRKSRISNDHPKSTGKISIPNLNDCDGALHIQGDEMHPLLVSGDLVLFKKISNLENGILWGEAYLLTISSGDDRYTLIRTLVKSKLGTKYILAKAYNSKYESKDILLKDIVSAMLIKASVHVYNMY